MPFRLFFLNLDNLGPIDLHSRISYIIRVISQTIPSFALSTHIYIRNDAIKQFIDPRINFGRRLAIAHLVYRCFSLSLLLAHLTNMIFITFVAH